MTAAFGQRPTTRAALAGVVLLCAAVAVLALGARAAFGAKPPSGTPTVSVAPNLTITPANYRIGQFLAKKETITGYTITFPTDTDVSAAATANAGDTITRNSGQRSVTITLGTPIVGSAAGTYFYAYVNNVRNPSTQGATYTLTVKINIQGGTSRTYTSAQYAIVTAPYLSMSISTQTASNTISFGSLDPEQSSPEATVVVDVVASGPYTITRTVSAEAVPLGLVFMSGGEAVGSKPAGQDSWTDSITVTPSWAATPGVYAVAITYTAVLDP
jgi:hypothetical protein